MSDLPRSVPLPPEDQELPQAAALFRGASSPRLLVGFLEERGWDLLDSRVSQALYRPGRSCTLRFRVHARPRIGPPRYMTMCLRVRARRIEPVAPPASFGARFGIDDPLEERDGVMIWAFPYDPMLPGLPDAAHGPTVRDAANVTRPASIAVSPLRYRPCQRAAIQYTVTGMAGVSETLWGKVVPDEAFARIFDAYRSFRASGVRIVEPRPAGELPGVALFPTIEGESLRDLIENGGALPDPQRLVDLLEELASVPWLGADDPGSPDRAVRSSGRLLAHILPERASEIRTIYRGLAERAAEAAPETFTVHGDLYEGQLFVDAKYRLGLIDFEDAGRGDPLMDAANMLAHLTVLHAYEPDAGGRPLAYRVMVRNALLQRLGGGEADLDWREALCLLHLATGPFRVQSPEWQEETHNRLDEVARLLRAPAALAA